MSEIDDRLLLEALDEARRSMDRMALLEKEKLKYRLKYGTPCQSVVMDNFDGSNADDTSDRFPDSTVSSWIHYWQIYTGHYENQMGSTCCGKPIFDDITTTPCKIMASKLNAAPTELKAIGGHVCIDGYQDYYITPLCPECNGQPRKTIHFHIGEVLAKEEHARIVKKD